VRRFGRMVRGVVSPGIHYRLPWPMEKVDKPEIRKIRRVSINYREKRAEKRKTLALSGGDGKDRTQNKEMYHISSLE